MITEKIRLLACAMIFASTALATTASAETNGWYVEGQYLTLEVDVDNSSDADLGGVGFVVGKDLSEYFAIELIGGVGIGDDKIKADSNSTTAKVEIDQYYGIVFKPNMDVNERFNVYLDLGYVHLKTEAEISSRGNTFKDSESDSEFMWGLGAEVGFTENFYGTVGYLDIDDSEGFQLSLGYRF